MTILLNASPVIIGLFNTRGIDRLRECFLATKDISKRLGAAGPRFWTYNPAGIFSTLVCRVGGLEEPDRMQIGCCLEFGFPGEDGPAEGTAQTLCRILVHDGTIWTAQELLAPEWDDMAGLKATRRWARLIAETAAFDRMVTALDDQGTETGAVLPGHDNPAG